MGLNIKGVDISMHNGAVDFNALKRAGIGAVIIKSTEGVDYVDPYCDRHTQGVKAAGISFGYYHFMSEKTNPDRQARDFWNKIKNTGFNIRPCLDIETNNYGRSRRQISDRCVEFLNTFRAISGLDCMIYTGGYFGRDNLDDRIKQYPGWIAHYGVNSPMNTGFRVIGHQYTENGRVDGISTRCDVNNFSEEIFLGNAPTIEPPKPMTPDEKAVVWHGNISKAKEIQESLIAKGYDCGSYGADGVFGKSTLEALKKFQKDNGLDVDGLCGNATWSKLEVKKAPTWVARLQEECNKQGFSHQAVDGIVGSNTINGCPLLRLGSSGNITKLMQEKLNALGYSTNGIDGIYGSGTKRAVRRFQADYGLSVDGICGKNTWKRLIYA